MDPSAAQIFNLGTISGSATSSGTPFGQGYSWAINSQLNGLALGVNLTTLIVGMRYNFSGLPAASAIIHEWWDATAAAVQVTLRVFNDGHFQFFLGTGTGTPIGPASAVGLARVSTWTQIETKVTISSTVGQVEMRMNGGATPIITTTASQNTQSTANAWVSGFLFESPVASPNSLWDDWYMLDTTGAAPLNTYLGNVQVKGDKSSANSAVGGRNAWTPTNPQNDNHLNVGNIPANAAQFNADSTPGDYDMFRFPPISAITVLFINEWALLELDAAGARTVELDGYSGGTDAPSQAYTPPSGSPQYFNQAYVKDPNTSAAWGVTAAGNAEFGVKVQT
jgi:hypothetical protein